MAARASCYGFCVDDPTAVPTWLMLAVIVGIPGSVVALLWFASGRENTQWLAYRCRRCEREFRGRAHDPFPAACPHCRAANWNDGAA
jgi:hypothetical protein